MHEQGQARLEDSVIGDLVPGLFALRLLLDAWGGRVGFLHSPRALLITLSLYRGLSWGVSVFPTGPT